MPFVIERFHSLLFFVNDVNILTYHTELYASFGVIEVEQGHSELVAPYFLLPSSITLITLHCFLPFKISANAVAFPQSPAMWQQAPVIQRMLLNIGVPQGTLQTMLFLRACCL